MEHIAEVIRKRRSVRTFDTPLTKEKAGNLAQPLEMGCRRK